MGRRATESGQPRLLKRFEFVDFLAAMAFVDKMAAIAEEEAAPPRLLRPLQPRGRHAVDTRRGRALRERLHPRRQDRPGSSRDAAAGVVIAGATGLMGTAPGGLMRPRRHHRVRAGARHRARARSALPGGEAARLGRDARTAARGGVRRRRRGGEPDRRAGRREALERRAQEAAARQPRRRDARARGRAPRICRSARGC